jgi:hypothetical protein
VGGARRRLYSAAGAISVALSSFGAPALLATLSISALVVGCGPSASFRLQLQGSKRTPPDASVTIDEQYVALLGEVALRGVRLPEGEHRITVERDGYFPWDRIVVSDGKPIRLEVDLVPIPD